MNEYTPRWLGEFEIIARAWYRNRDSDSVQIQKLRANERAIGHGLLQGEIQSLREHDKYLMLRVGEQAVRALSFQSMPYDFTASILEEIPAGDTINLKRWRLARDGFNQDAEPYYGEYLYVNFGEIGKTLTEGGSLETVDASELESLRASSMNE
jgi:hypothetical protein